jgi:hypothetical protein
LPTDADDNKSFFWDIDLRGRKRYLDVVATVDDGTDGVYVTIFAFGLHCPEVDIVHIGVWHSSVVLLMGAVGRMVVPSLVRW